MNVAGDFGTQGATNIERALPAHVGDVYKTIAEITAHAQALEQTVRMIADSMWGSIPRDTEAVGLMGGAMPKGQHGVFQALEGLRQTLSRVGKELDRF